MKVSHMSKCYVSIRVGKYNFPWEDIVLDTVKSGFGSPPKGRGKNRGDCNPISGPRVKTKLSYYL